MYNKVSGVPTYLHAYFYTSDNTYSYTTIGIYITNYN